MLGYLVSLALGLSSYCLRHIQVVCSYRCRSCSSHPLPSLFFLAKTSASMVLTVSSAPDSGRAITFGTFSLLSIALRPLLLLAKLARWSGGSGAWLPLFLFPFPLGSSSLRGYWKRSWNGTSCRVVPLSAWGIALPPLWRSRAMDAESCR